MWACCDDPSEKEQKKINAEIEKQIRKAKHEENSEVKLLLLGAGESGKSTFLKQMKIIHGAGYSHAERLQFVRLICQNIVCAVQTLVTAMQTLGISFEDEVSTSPAASLLCRLDVNSVGSLDEAAASAVKNVWADGGVRRCYASRSKFHLSDSAEYFLDSVDRIAAPGYLPTDQDVLRARAPTTGVKEYTFEYKSARFRLVDVGGQRSERRKWINCFENVFAVIFLVAMSEYDQTLRESDENRLRESLALFRTIVMKYAWSEETFFILFLNKNDLLSDKIASSSSHLKDYFPEFGGQAGDDSGAREFIRKLFLQHLPKDKAEKVYPFYTCATDTDNMRHIFKTVKEEIISRHIPIFFP